MALPSIMVAVLDECGVDTEPCGHWSIAEEARGGGHAEPILTTMPAKPARKLNRRTKATASPTAVRGAGPPRMRCLPEER